MKLLEALESLIQNNQFRIPLTILVLIDLTVPNKLRKSNLKIIILRLSQVP